MRASTYTSGGKKKVSQISCEACNWSTSVTWKDKYYQDGHQGVLAGWHVRGVDPKIYVGELLEEHACRLDEFPISSIDLEEITYTDKQLNPLLVNYEDHILNNPLKTSGVCHNKR